MLAPPRLVFISVIAAIVLSSAALSQGIKGTQREPPSESGQSVTPAYEGWYQNADGTYTISIGYYNRNTKEVLDIPVGPNNHIDPGGPDQGQPTHFLIGRQWGVFTVTVPKDFGPDKKLTWTIVANGKAMEVPFKLDPLWVIKPFVDATGNTPPFLAFAEAGPFLQGPPRAISQTLSTSVGTPLPLTVWVADDANVPPPFEAFAKMIPAVSVSWIKFRGPGEVTFTKAKPKAEKLEFKAPPNTAFTAKADTSASFSEPGDYILEVTANDISGVGGGGFQCCWTSTDVKVTVKP